MDRKPAHCPNGHDCNKTGVINGLFIMCNKCIWIDDSTFEDIENSVGYVRIPTKEDK